MSRFAFISLLAMLALTACSAGSMISGGAPAMGSGGDSRSDQATRAACRQRVSEMYDRRERGDIYAANSSMNSPFSANYQPGVGDRQLADRFSYDQITNDCVRNSGTGAARDSDIPEPAVTRH